MATDTKRAYRRRSTANDAAHPIETPSEPSLQGALNAPMDNGMSAPIESGQDELVRSEPNVSAESETSVSAKSVPHAPVKKRRSAPAKRETVALKSQPAATAPSEPVKKRRVGRRLLVLLALLSILVAALPTIITKTPLLQWGLNLAASDVNGSVTVASASFGWLSPLEVRDFEVKDATGVPALTLPSVTGEKSLLQMLAGYANLGKFRLEKPRFEVVLRDDGTNIEDLLAKYLASNENKAPASQSSSPIGLSLEVINGSIAISDKNTGRSWQVKKLSAELQMPEGAAGPVTASVSADLPEGKQPGKITGSLKMAAGGNEAKLSIKGLPAGVCRALASRFSPGTTCEGQLSSELTASWGVANKKSSVKANLGTEEFSLASPTLQSDVVRFDRFQAGCFVSWEPDRIEIEQSAVNCDLGNISLVSTIQRDKQGEVSFNALLHQRHELSGWLDMAKIARLLPATLHVRKDVNVESGMVRFSLSSRRAQEGAAWQAKVNADNITANASGRRITWQQPLMLALDAHETPDGPVVDNLQCESEFLKMHANGTPDAFGASLSINLKPLSTQLGQFVDLGALQMAGEGWGNWNWKRTPQQQFDTDGEIQLRNFQIGLPNQQPWREDNLAATFVAKGKTNLGVETQIDSAAVSVKSGGNQIDARLTQPVKDLKNGGTWPVHVETQGQLQNWPDRLLTWFSAKECRLSGAYIMVVDGTVAADNITMRQVALAAAPLVMNSPWANINETRVDATLAGSWDQAKRRLEIEPATLNCATVAVQANKLVLAMSDKGPSELAGTIKFQGDAGRVRQWLASTGNAATWQLAGKLNGTLQLHSADGVVHGETTTEVNNLMIIDAAGQQFQEPQVRLVARGTYNHQTGITQMEQAELTSSVVAAGAGGRIAPVSGQNNLEVNGQLAYDMERLVGMLRPYLGPGVRVTGRGSSEAWYRGPFALASSQGAAGVKWDAANVYGLQVGPGELKVAVMNGLLRVSPIDIVASGGRVHLAPTVRLTPQPIELTLPQGPIAQNIQIDTAMCGTMLKYVAPVVAGVASAQGSFSVDIDSCRLPLGDLGHGDLAGRFTIHTAQVASGPMIRALATFLNRETPATLKRESVVQFKMADGRVYHEGLELIFPDITIRTRGWVGLDQTVNIQAEMPVPAKWLQNNPVAAQTFRNQTIRIPITGTLSRPVLDQKVLEGYTRQFIQKAAVNAIQGQVDKELDRLFGPRK